MAVFGEVFTGQNGITYSDAKRCPIIEGYWTRQFADTHGALAQFSSAKAPPTSDDPPHPTGCSVATRTHPRPIFSDKMAILNLFSSDSFEDSLSGV
jgi:hypothetical protein